MIFSKKIGFFHFFVFLASFFWKKLQAFLENVASPFWRKLQPHGVAGATPWKQTFFVKSY